jgi:hypothetical protein
VGKNGAGTQLRVSVEDTSLIITGAFLCTGLLACVIIPGLLVMWDRVLDHMEEEDNRHP